MRLHKRLWKVTDGKEGGGGGKGKGSGGREEAVHLLLHWIKDPRTPREQSAVLEPLQASQR